MRLENIKIYTCDESNIIDNGYIEYDEKGKIISLGKSDGEPSGLVCYPGFIDSHTHLGMVEDSLSYEGDDVNETSSPITPSLDTVDGCNPFDQYFHDAVKHGITSVAISPGSSNPIGGKISVIKTAGTVIDKMILKKDAAVKFAFGENPKKSFGLENNAPVTRMSIASLIRDELYKAEIYKLKKDNYNVTNDIGDIPDYDGNLEALLPLFNHTAVAHVHAHRADDISTAIRIFKDFNIDFVIVHCTEGYLIADYLAEQNVKCMLGPNLTDRSKPELKNQSFNNLLVLNNHGVDFSIITDHPETMIGYLPLCSAMAVKNGLNKTASLEAITSKPAEILGLSDRIGSIKEGKDADFTVYNGEIFDLYSECVLTVINGVTVYDHRKQQ